MLNEIQEYTEYTSAIKDMPVLRLMPDLFMEKNKLRGLVRAMTVVARAELERVGYFEASLEEQSGLIVSVISALRQWCGFAETVGTELGPGCNEVGWLEQYYKKVIEVTERSGLLSWEEVVKKKARQFETTIVGAINKTSEADTMLSISYEKIVANAVYLGPLKRYYLVCREGAEEALESNGSKLRIYGKNRKQKDCEKADNVLRLVAAYLLKQRLTGTEANQVNMTDLGYWAQNKKVCDSEYFRSVNKGKEYGIQYKKKRIYSSETIKKNITKIVVNPQYLADFDFQLVEEEAFDVVAPGYTFFSDFGAGMPLKKDVRYEKRKRKNRDKEVLG